METKYITEYAWDKIMTFLRSVKGIYIVSPRKIKRFIKAVLWIMRTGAQWRELPREYGKWNTVFTRFNEWARKNIWDQLLNFCIHEPDLESIMIDTTIIRSHPCAAGYRKDSQDAEGLGRSKGGFTTKVHAKVDALGNPLMFTITPGQRSDFIEAPKLLADIENAYVIADKGYDSNAIRELIQQQNCIAVIPPRSNRTTLIDYDEYIYKERHAIECFFSKIKQFRRIFSRFDKSARNFAAFLSFAGALVWLR
jgi:transposase